MPSSERTARTDQQEDSTFLAHTACPACGSSDGNSLYTDGHTFCFVCAAHSAGNGPPSTTTHYRRPLAQGLIEVTPQSFQKRGLRLETTKHYGYGLGEVNGRQVQVATYYNAEGEAVGQKTRDAQKRFAWLGSSKSVMPFGWHVGSRSGPKLVLTEGEIDAMSLAQLDDCKYPVWSIPTGAGAQMGKWLADVRQQGVFDNFGEVIIMFDSDAVGKSAAKMAAEIIGAKALITELPLKDANEMLLAGRFKELKNAVFNGKKHHPEGIVDIASLRETVADSTPEGIHYLYAGMNRITHGMRTGEIITIGAGTGAGKTDFLTELMTHMVLKEHLSVGAFFLESTPVELARRFAGKIMDKPFHIPGVGTSDDYAEAWDRIDAAGSKVFLYDSFGVNEWDAIQTKIEYLYHAEGVQYFIVDHLTAFAAADPSNERQVLEEVMGKAGSLVKAIPITVFLVSHLATPEGKSHEEGGHIAMRHFKGARAIGQWTHIAFGLERNQQAENMQERFTTTVRCVKNRLFGHLNGELFYLRYNPSTGRLVEVPDDGTGDTPAGFEREASTATPTPSDF